MHYRSKTSVGAAAVLAAALAACTPASPPPPDGPKGPWALEQLAPAPVTPDVQAAADAPPATGHAKIIGLADLPGARIVLALRAGRCEALLLPPATAPAGGAGAASFGAPRPIGEISPTVDRKEFPGGIIETPYSRSSGISTPYFDYLSLGCSENAMAVRLEGAPAKESATTLGDSVQTWRDGRYFYITAGRATRPSP
ncbi:hypothetical protein [Kitasatospora sp. NPDC051914]|uniref:hypothetical protein n=1 Tax=Kitasatospora sp. NPDC051914 TaxID=3154945 RepID=UPI003449D81E